MPFARRDYQAFDSHISHQSMRAIGAEDVRDAAPQRQFMLCTAQSMTDCPKVPA